MRQASHLSVVQDGDLPPPLVPPEVIIKDMPEGLMPQAMFDSDWWITASREARLYGFTLNLKSYKQKPAGSLPSDDRLLARLAECDHDEFLAVRDQVLEGWMLCSDGRYYRQSIAIKVLAFWISRLFKRRSSAAGNAAQDREVPSADEFNRPLFLAEEALAQLDPTHKEVRKCRAHRAKLAKQLRETAIAHGVSPEAFEGPGASPGGTPDRSPKGREAKLSESSEYIPSAAQAAEVESSSEDSRTGCGQQGKTSPRTPVLPWPLDGMEQFWAPWPNKVGRKEAVEAFAELVDNPPIEFPALIEAVKLYAARKPLSNDWAHPATWLRNNRWEDVWPDPPPPKRDRLASGSGRPFQPQRLNSRRH